MIDPVHFTRKLRLVPLALMTGAAAACYSAEFDEDASGLYICEADSDCGDNFRCFEGLCLLDEGPKITVLGPEFLQQFQAGSSVFPFSFRATDLTLVEPGGPDDGQSGYIEVFLDGEPLTDVNPITSGPITTGIQLDADAGVALRGGHRLEAKVFRPDGTQYTNPSAFGRSIFFVENGSHTVPGTSNEAELPLAVITSPWPGDVIDRDEDLRLEVSTLNWTWVDASEPEPAVQGHAHVYFDIPDYPACQPNCNLLYRDTLQPSTSEEVDARTLAVPIGLSENDGPNGSLRVSVTLHKSDHTVYPDPPDPNGTPEEQEAALNRLAADSIEVFVE